VSGNSFILFFNMSLMNTKNEVLKFGAKLILFVVLFMVLAFIFASLPQWRFQFTNGDTESNLLITPSGEHFDVVMLGTSHGRTFSRYGNHEELERILESRILNLSKGNGGGPFPEFLFLDYFFRQGNTADVVLYVIDPWVLYSPQWNEENFFLSDEPLNAEFLALALQQGTDRQVMSNYVKTKLGFSWFLSKPAIVSRDERSLSEIDQESVKRRRENLYPDGMNESYANSSAQYTEKILDLVRSNQAKAIFIIPPTLLGDLPGEGDLVKRLEKWREVYSIEFFDFSNAIVDPSLYGDHDHLNSNGIEIFIQQFIKPILY